MSLVDGMDAVSVNQRAYTNEEIARLKVELSERQGSVKELPNMVGMVGWCGFMAAIPVLLGVAVLYGLLRPLLGHQVGWVTVLGAPLVVIFCLAIILSIKNLFDRRKEFEIELARIEKEKTEGIIYEISVVARNIYSPEPRPYNQKTGASSHPVYLIELEGGKLAYLHVSRAVEECDDKAWRKQIQIKYAPGLYRVLDIRCEGEPLAISQLAVPIILGNWADYFEFPIRIVTGTMATLSDDLQNPEKLIFPQSTSRASDLVQ
jgi:hypothetical protein